MASKRKCGFCKNYFDKDTMVGNGVSVFCSVNHMYLSNKPKKKESKVTKKFTTDLKAKIRKRDGGCVFGCGRKDLEVHHIVYRSALGSKDRFGTMWDEINLNHPSNLITLCGVHHKIVHSDKEYWQPLMLGYIWYRYFYDKKISINRLKKEVLSWNIGS